MNSPSKFLACLGLLIGGGMALGQAISPPIAEYRGMKAEGSFRIDNTTDTEMTVILETKSFRVNNLGKVEYLLLQPQVHLDLGSTSFTVHPHDSHIVYYKAVSAISPISFAIIPTMLPMVKTAGVRIGYVFPHMVYLYQKSKLSKSDIQTDLKDGKLTIVNNSEKLGRIEIIHDGDNKLNGFPLYPGQTRQIAVTASKEVINFEEGFKIEVR